MPKKNILKICNYSGKIATANHHDSGAAYFLYQIIKDKPDLLNKLADHRDDLIENHKDLIIKIRGQEWFDERKIDIETLAETDPEKFLDRFENLIERFGNDVIKQLSKVNIEEIYRKNPDLILKNIPSFIGRVPDLEFQNIFNKIDVDSFIKSYPDSFKDLLKFLSDERSNKIYFSIFNYLMNDKTKEILAVFGNDMIGLAKFMQFLESPRERIHQKAKYDPRNNVYKGIRQELVLDADGRPLRDENGVRITTPKEFIIKDDKKVLLQKERKKFLEKNKELIKSFIKSDEFTKELTFLKLYIPQISDQEVNKILDSKTDQNISLKEKIINYFTEKYDNYLKDIKTGNQKLIQQKYGTKGVLPGILAFHNHFKFSNKNDNYIPLSELKKNMNDLLLYFYTNSKEDKDESKKIDAYTNFLKLCKENKVSKEELIKLIKNVSIDIKKNPIFATNFYAKVFNIFDKKVAMQLANEVKNEFLKLGEQGKYNFEFILKKVSLERYKVKRGDMVMFKGNGDRMEKLNLISGKKYLVIDTKNKYKISNVDPESEMELAIENVEAINYYVLVNEENEIENGGLNIWVPSERFDIKKELLSEFSLNENFKIFENKFKKLKNILKETEERKPKYSAIVLDEKSKNKLKILIEKLKKEGAIGEDWAISADHITINLGKIYDPDLLNNIVNIKAIAIGKNKNVVALKVTVNLDINFSTKKERTPHITLAFNKPEGAKPVMSNYIENWENMNIIELQGIIQEVF